MRWVSFIPLICLLLVVVFLIPLDRALFALPIPIRIALGSLAAICFLVSLRCEKPERRQAYLALALPITILVLSPINTSLEAGHVVILGVAFVAVLVLPTLMLRGEDIISYKFFPDKLDWVDIFYTAISVPLAWGGFALYFGYLSPEVPFNWTLPPQPDMAELGKLFMGINAVGIWDELFFVNICYAILRFLFPMRIANVSQAVIYTTVLYDMAFSGWGPLFIFVLALTQGFMYERSKVLIWVLIVHLIVDYFLFQAIVETYYPGLDVWWH